MMNNHHEIEEEFHDNTFAEHDIEDWLYLGLTRTLVVDCNDVVLAYVGSRATIVLYNDCRLKVTQCCCSVNFHDANFNFVAEMVENLKRG